MTAAVLTNTQLHVALDTRGLHSLSRHRFTIESVAVRLIYITVIDLKCHNVILMDTWILGVVSKQLRLLRAESGTPPLR